MLIKRFLVFVNALFCTGILFVSGGGVSALELSGVRDCDANAVIRCGAMTSAELAQKYKSNDSIADIYGYFGISAGDINNIDHAAQAGTVTNTGLVKINDKTVATDAMTAGRQNITGSTALSRGGTSFFIRPTSVSFVSDSLPAFVVMQDGRFAYAILASCGNPVKAKPVAPITKTVAPKTAAKPAPQTAAPAATTSPTTQNVNIVNNNSNSQSQAQSQVQTSSAVPATVTAQAQTPTTSAQSQAQAQPQTQTETAAPAPAPATTPAALPNTGSGAALAISLLTTIGATVGHMFYKRFKSNLG